MSKHTPGPWVTGNTNPMLFGVQRGNGTEPIGFVYGPSFPERSEVGMRALANAKLVAAAPEMLDALQRLIDFSPGTENQATKQARAAIAKALGETA